MLFCLEKRLSKHKMTIFSKNVWGGMAHFSPPGYAYVPTIPPTQSGNGQKHSMPSAVRDHMALICTGTTIETATNHVHYDVTRLANPCALRQASVDRHASVDRN